MNSSPLSPLVISFILRDLTLSNFTQTRKKNFLSRKGLGTSLALQCYAGFVSSGFPSQSRKINEMTRGDKGEMFILFVS